MCTPRLRARVPSAQAVTTGYVAQRKFVFHKRSIDGSAKADAAFTDSPTDQVWGVVFQVHQHEKPILDEDEFLGIGYDQEIVDVVHDKGSLKAWIYVARHDTIDHSLLPYTWYHDFVLHGAGQYGLPNHYIDYLRGLNAQVDSDLIRHANNRKLIEG